MAARVKRKTRYRERTNPPRIEYLDHAYRLMNAESVSSITQLRSRLLQDLTALITSAGTKDAIKYEWKRDSGKHTITCTLPIFSRWAITFIFGGHAFPINATWNDETLKETINKVKRASQAARDVIMTFNSYMHVECNGHIFELTPLTSLLDIGARDNDIVEFLSMPERTRE